MMETGICQSHGTPALPQPRMSPRGRTKPCPHPHRPRKRVHVFLGYAPGYGLRVHSFCRSRSPSRSLLAYLVPELLGLTVYY